MDFAAKLATVAAFGLVLSCCASKPAYYGYKPSVAPEAAMADLETCYRNNELSSVAEIKAAQIIHRAATKQTGAANATNTCLQQKGYEIRQVTPEDHKRLMAMDVPRRKEAFATLMTTGTF